MSSQRVRRVDEAIRQSLGPLVAHEVKDPRIGFVTITAVRCTTDLRYARVLISVLGDQKSETIEGLKSSAGFLQRRVGEQLAMKHTPVLRFELDETIDRAERIERLLNADPGPRLESSNEEDTDV